MIDLFPTTAFYFESPSAKLAILLFILFPFLWCAVPIFNHFLIHIAIFSDFIGDHGRFQILGLEF